MLVIKGMSSTNSVPREKKQSELTRSTYRKNIETKSSIDDPNRSLCAKEQLAQNITSQKILQNNNLDLNIKNSQTLMTRTISSFVYSGNKCMVDQNGRRIDRIINIFFTTTTKKEQ